MTTLSTYPIPSPVFDHLDRLSDERGLFEHAVHALPRPEHGYCVDDVARGLVVVCREPSPSSAVRRLSRRYLDFVLEALAPAGSCHNRMDVTGEWRDEPGHGDWWGRAVWGLGVAAIRADTPGMRARAMAGFRVAAQQRSPHLRAMAFAALGAAAVLTERPDELTAMDLLRDALGRIDTTRTDAEWPWPEPRLSYGNGSVAEAVIVAGHLLGDAAALRSGLLMLAFLLRTETRDGHFSVTPVGGRGEGDASPVFDQQPIEVAALADACATAYRVTGETRWLIAVQLAWRWFLGDNDSGVPMFDPITGGGYDGLEPEGCNLNQGAESTLAMLSVAQHARRIEAVPGRGVPR
jgi:hypothetical protein